jgi:drug/metabolite transporter (DMT)-like permease
MTAPATTSAPAAEVPSTRSTALRTRALRGGRLDWRVNFAILSLVWGFSFLLIKIGTDGYAPFQVAFGRMLAGAAVLLVALAARRERMPRGIGVWWRLAVAAVLLNALPWALFAYSEQLVPSQLAAIANATSPLWGMLLALVALREDRPTRRRLAGLALGFAGVLTVLGAWQGFSGANPLGTVLALLASLCYPIGWIWVRRTLGGRPESHLALSGTQLLLGAAEGAIAMAVGSGLPQHFPLGPTLAVLALGVFGTGIAMLLQYGLVAEVGPTVGQSVTYVVPVVATAAGVLLLGEALHWNTVVGAVVVLAGAALTQSRARRG